MCISIRVRMSSLASIRILVSGFHIMHNVQICLFLSGMAMFENSERFNDAFP